MTTSDTRRLVTSSFDRTVLPNGLRILTSTFRHTNAVSIIFLFGAGSRYETPELAGASHLFEHLLFKGTPRRPTPRQISEVVEGVGGSLNAFTDREVTGYWCRLAQPHYREGIDLLADMALNSLFRDEDIDKEKQVVYEEIRASFDSPGARTSMLLDGLLWPDQTMGRDIAGSIESVGAISRDEMRKYLETQYVASNTVIAVAGNIEHEDVVEQLTELLGGLRDGEILPMYPFEDKIDGPRVALEHRPTEQAHLAFGLPGLSQDDSDRHALALMSVILGESMSSRLFEEIREKRGLAYDIHSGAQFYRDCGAFVVESGIDPARIDEAIPVILGELGKMRDGVTEEEWSQARELTKGRMMLRMEESRAVTSFLGIQELLRNKVESVDAVIAKIDAVTMDDIKRVANRIINPEKLALAIVGPFEDSSRFEKPLKFD
ncbi:MAG: insulinase family protein [Chloroflexi bacterium]|nr:insulinase family protein [Chloroflexota bacterium]MCI0836952.1 insulinase family protein [Chloroflexota bacterium]MCI0850542.1 insulinase family protein [Chloroflexota bacterium]